MDGLMEQYQLWMDKAMLDSDIVKELKEISGDFVRIEDAFYKDLVFGTGGLRGVIGAGTNRMNIYTVARASQGLANYVIKNYSADKRSIAVSFDSRIKSDLFAKISASVFAANGISVYIYRELMPTPCLSFAVRQLSCAAGIMITASHNPARYNGYKVYGEDGCQITTKAADDILSEINKLDYFEDIKSIAYENGIKEGKIRYISENICTEFVEMVKKQSVLGKGDKIDKNVAIVYSPLNGTGLKPVLRVLKESGYINITVVKEQEKPNGNFPTCPYPNPEIREAMNLGIQYAKKYNADILLATDPDCDRIGIAVKNEFGEYRLLSGNETGILLLDYICSRRIAQGIMPESPLMMKTIVTTDMGEQIARHYGLRTIDVLTGFKYIGEQIGFLEQNGMAESYVFGFEESYGYLSGSYVRDKDAVGGAFLICEMFAYYKTKGISLLDKLEELYQLYGYCLNTLHSYEFEGVAGIEKMQQIMEKFRTGLENIGSKEIRKCIDYLQGIDGLPQSDVLKFTLNDNCSVVVRPSGTEPKLKIYVSVSAQSMEEAKTIEKNIVKDIESIISET